MLSRGWFTGALFICLVVSLITSGTAQNLSTPVTKVIQMLGDMKAKSQKLKTEADDTYTKVAQDCKDMISTKQDEILTLTMAITKLKAEVLQLETDINSLVAAIANDQSTYQQNSATLDDVRKTRSTEVKSYERDLSEYTIAITAVDRAMDIMQKHAAFLSISQTNRKTNQIQSVLKEVASSLRQISAYQPDDGGLAKDEKIFDDFNSLTTSSGAYQSVSGTGKGVIGVLKGLKSTFAKAKDQLMVDEKANKATFLKTEQNLLQQLQTTRDSVASLKMKLAQSEESLTTKKTDLSQATLNKDSTGKFLNRTQAICDNKKKAYDEMSKLRTQEITALTKAIDIMSGTVSANSNSLNSKVLLQTIAESHLQHPDDAVGSLNVFIRKTAVRLRSSSLTLLARGVKSLSAQAPADVLAKVKQMISDLILKLQQDSAAEATQNAWCKDELAKNENERKVAADDIKRHTAQVKKVGGDINMLQQEITLLGQGISLATTEKADIAAIRKAEEKQFNATRDDAKDSIAAVEAAITVIGDYYTLAAKAQAFVQKAPTLTNNTLPTSLTAPETEGPLQTEGANVIAMLEVVRDGYKTLLSNLGKQEAQAKVLYQEELKDITVMIASASSDHANKQKLVAQLNVDLPQAQSDLNASQQALVDAKVNYENLKAPCLNGNAAEQRKQQLEGEIAALKEALAMVETYQSSSVLLQKPHSPSPISFGFIQEGNNTVQVQKVAQLLKGIRDDVQKDLDSDTTAYNEMKNWCTATISETMAAIKVQQDRDSELVTAIEISAQQKTVLETQLTSLKADVGKNSVSLDRMAQLRSNAQAAFEKSEKEMIVAISSLRSAISILDSRYKAWEKKDKRNFTQEQQQLSSVKPKLIHIADQVAKALKVLPANQFHVAITGETGAILQNFFAKPEQVLLSFSNHAGLAQADLFIAPGSGKQILGILQSLLETVEADLAAARTKETQSIANYGSTKAAKQSQGSAMEANIATKESQLAHYTTMNAQAKEDLAYLRETNKHDVAYLAQVRETCAVSDNEYVLRKKTREDELAAIDEAISILTAGAGVSAGAGAVASPTPSPPLVLGHTARHVRRVFVHHHAASKRPVLKIGALSGASAPKTALIHSSRTQVPRKRTAAMLLKSVSVTQHVQSRSEPLETSLAALVAQVRLAQGQISRGPLTSGAIQSVVTQIDAVVVDLQDQKKLEIKQKDTCIRENNSAIEQRERRETDKAKLNNTIIQLTANIKKSTQSLADIQKQITELNDALKKLAAARAVAHSEYKTSVQTQLDHQKLLHQALTALKQFYATKRVGLLQSAPDNLQSLLAGLEVQLADAGQTVTERHIESNGELAKQASQYNEWARHANLRTVCETGFNAGHSALHFLAQSNATVYEFDLGVHDYGKVGAAFLLDRFAGRLHNLWGDSSVVLPLFIEQRSDVKCDLMIVDGGHEYEVALADLKNFARIATSNHILAIDNTPCAADYCVGPTRAWQELMKQGCVKQAQAIPMGKDRGFSFGHYEPCELWSDIPGLSAGPQSGVISQSAIAVDGANTNLSSAASDVAIKSSPQAIPIKLTIQKHQAANATHPHWATLDDDITKHSGTKWGSVKNVKANRTEMPKGFRKKLRTHDGSIGVISILELLLQDSEALIEQDVKDEQSDVNQHLANIAKTNELIKSKNAETVMLTQVKNDDQLKKTQLQQQLQTVETEIKQIDKFLGIVAKKCTLVIKNFNTNQVARAQEISDVIQAKEVLLGMIEGSAAALFQLSRVVARLRKRVQ